MELNQSGADLLVNVMDVIEKFDRIPPEDIKLLLKEVEVVLRDFLNRDIPPASEPDAQLQR